MNNQMIGAALIQLADIVNCASGDFHCLHFNVAGNEFDTFHSKVLKKYYENASNDFDELCEKARMFEVIIPSPNESAVRLKYDSINLTGRTLKADCILYIHDIIECIIEAFSKVFIITNQILDDSRCIGVANFLQGRLEYWTKELWFFNANRRE